MVRWPGFPFPRTDSSHGFSDGDAERGEAVQDGDANLELGHLTVEVPRQKALTRQFHTVHLRISALPNSTFIVRQVMNGRVARDGLPTLLAG